MSNSATCPRITRAPVALDDCGLARACDLLGGRWTLLILREAFYGVSRFEDLRADLDAPRAALSQRLDLLVVEGVLERRLYQEEKSRRRREYRLTEKGRELAIVLIALMQWGDRHLRDDRPPLDIVDAKTRERLTVALATRKGRVVPLRDAAPVLRKRSSKA